MMVESGDADSMASSSAGTMVLPAHALGTNYMTMSYQQFDTPKIDAVPGSQGGAAEYSVVATQDHTSLWIYAPGLPEMAMPMPVMLEHDGDVFHQSSMGDHDNLTRARSSHPTSAWRCSRGTSRPPMVRAPAD